MPNTEVPKFKIQPQDTYEIQLKNLEENYSKHAFEYNLFSIKKFQTYYPIYNLFFNLNESNFNKTILNQKYSFIDTTAVKNNITDEVLSKSVFIKCSPLINPTKYLIGKYDNDNSIYYLPSLHEIDNDKVNKKMLNTNNISYIDNFFSFLCSQLLNTHNVINCIDYYGTFLGLQNKFKTNITDDLEFLYNHPYFLSNMNKTFEVENLQYQELFSYGSRNNRDKIKLSDTPKHNISVSSLPELEIETITENKGELIYENNSISVRDESSENEEFSSDSDDSELNNSDDESIQATDEEEEEEEEESSIENDEEETNTYAYIPNYPVQFICLERCNGTFDDLLENQQINETTILIHKYSLN